MSYSLLYVNDMWVLISYADDLKIYSCIYSYFDVVVLQFFR